MGFQKLKMNKKGVQLKSAFFAVVAVSMIIIAAGVIIGEWDTQYNSGLNYDLSEYDELDSFSQEAETQKGQITPQDADPGSGDFEGRIFRGGYGILGRIFLPFQSVFNMLESVEERFGMPNYVMEGVLTLVFFSLIFSLVAIIFRLGRTSA